LQECKRRGLKVVVAGIPKTIDNDIDVRCFLLIYNTQAC
jgi:6-phosphofructokinase